MTTLVDSGRWERLCEDFRSPRSPELVFMVFEKDAEHTKKDPSEKEEI